MCRDSASRNKKKVRWRQKTAVSLVVGEPEKQMSCRWRKRCFFSGWEDVLFPRNLARYHVAFMWPVLSYFSCLHVGKSSIPMEHLGMFFWGALAYLQHHAYIRSTLPHAYIRCLLKSWIHFWIVRTVVPWISRMGKRELSFISLVGS